VPSGIRPGSPSSTIQECAFRPDWPLAGSGEEQLLAAVRVNDEHGPLVGEEFLIGGEGLVEGGRFLAARVLPIWTDSLGVFVRKEAEHSQARIVIALRRYEVRKHALPERLEELVPEFLEEIPPDSVDGTPMRYRRRSARRSLVWAIGSDEIDGGGPRLPMGEAKRDRRG
jgi:hypothetical protein